MFNSGLIHIIYIYTYIYIYIFYTIRTAYIGKPSEL